MVAGAVWYATGYLYSLYTAAEHSILALQQQGPACPWRLAAAAEEQIERLSVVLQAVSRCRWFTSCLGLSDMALATHIAYIQPARDNGVLALFGPGTGWNPGGSLWFLLGI